MVAHAPSPQKFMLITQLKKLPYRRSETGATLIELLTVTSIVAVLALLAAPSLATHIESQRVKETVEQLKSTLYFARSEAIKRGGFIAIQKIPINSSDCQTATSTRDWDCGWIVCHDTNSNGTCNATEPVLQYIKTSGKVHVNRSAGGANIKINRWGLVDGAWLGFSLTPLTKTLGDPSARGVCMSSGGRIRVLAQKDIPCTA
jgi:type IV fimbrial biogenesis protein FimT